MTVQELYDYTTSQMSPGEALKKLLEGNILNYKKLKFNKGEEIHPLILIADAAFDMGWDIAIEKDKEDVRGVCVGTEEYMKTVFKGNRINEKH